MWLVEMLLSLFGMWRKSSRSNGNGGNNCVEVATNFRVLVAIRDSKDPYGGTLVITRGMMRDLVNGAKADEFTLVA